MKPTANSISHERRRPSSACDNAARAHTACGSAVHARTGCSSTAPQALRASGRLRGRPRHRLSPESHHLQAVLALGFKVDVDHSQVQVENACGVVACAVASRLQLPDWQTADVSFAAARSTKVECLRLLYGPSSGPLPPLLACPPLCTSELHALYNLLNVRIRARFSVLPYMMCCSGSCTLVCESVLLVRTFAYMYATQSTAGSRVGIGSPCSVQYCVRAIHIVKYE